jgi:hypothetical protein
VGATIGLLAVSASPASADANYGSSGTFWTSGDQCSKWAHSWTSWTQVTTGLPPRAWVNLAGYTTATQSSCWSPLNLPEGWIYATGDLYWLHNGNWELWMHIPVTNLGGGSVASLSQDASVQPTWYYTRGTWQALQGGALHTKQTGSDYPVQYLAP